MTYEQMQAKQLKLSAVLAVIFLASMFVIPFLNHSMTDAMLTPVMGLPLIWLLVGILLHLEFWVIALLYTYLSNKWEGEVDNG